MSARLALSHDCVVKVDGLFAEIKVDYPTDKDQISSCCFAEFMSYRSLVVT